MSNFDYSAPIYESMHVSNVSSYGRPVKVYEDHFINGKRVYREISFVGIFHCFITNNQYRSTLIEDSEGFIQAVAIDRIQFIDKE